MKKEKAYSQTKRWKKVSKLFAIIAAIALVAITFRAVDVFGSRSLIFGIGAKFFPTLYSEQELVAAMEESFNAEFTIEAKKIGYGRCTYIMIPEFDPEERITVWTYCDVYYSDGGNVIGYQAYASNSYFTDKLSKNLVEAKKIAKEYGFELKKEEKYSYTLYIKSYDELEKAAECFQSINELLDLHYYSPPSIEEYPGSFYKMSFFGGESDPYMVFSLDEQIYGRDPKGFGFFALEYFTVGGSKRDDLSDTLRGEYTEYFEKRPNLEDPTFCTDF